MTNNYLKVRRGKFSTEFFFDATHPVSVASALRAAGDYAKAITPQIAGPSEVEAPVMSVWSHGVRGLGDLPCVGGCELCSPRQEIEIEEADGPQER